MTSGPTGHRRPSPRSAAVLIAALLGACALAGCGSTSAPEAAPTIAAGSQLGGPLPPAIARIPFTDAAGHTVRLADYRGKTVVLQDVLTLCQEHCPIDTAAFVGAARAYAAGPHASDVVFLSITVDPQRDTVAQLAAYRKLYAGASHNLPHWHLLTGSPADITKLWKTLHVYVQRVPQDAVVRNWRTGQRLTYDVDQGDEVFFIDPRGRERYVLVGQPSTSNGTIPPAMQKFMTRQGHANEKKGSWTTADELNVLRWLTHT